jgi:hypothetical protein
VISVGRVEVTDNLVFLEVGQAAPVVHRRGCGLEGDPCAPTTIESPTMGGFFIDDVIRTIARTVRREVRIKKAAKWPVAVGKILRFRTTDGDWRRLRPVVDYQYEVNGQIQYGFTTGYSSKDVNEIGDAVDTLGELKIRFDPRDPYVNRVLNEDNPKLPFAVDHEIS